VNSVAFSPDGTKLLSGSWDRTLKLWNVSTGELLRTFGSNEVVNAAAFTPDGGSVLAGGWDVDHLRNALNLWNVAAGGIQSTFKEQLAVVESVAVSPKGASAVSADLDGKINIWKLGNGELLASLIDTGDGNGLAITAPEGFFSGSEKAAQLVSVVRGFEVYSVDQFFQSLYRPDLVRQKLSGELENVVNVKMARHDIDLKTVLNSGAAPKIAVTSPGGDREFVDSDVNVEATVVNQGGGFGRLEWRVNGVVLGVQTLGNAGAASSHDQKVTRKFSLGEGTSVIEAVAYNSANLIASLPASVVVKVSSTAARPLPRLYVLAVGVDKYFDQTMTLNFAASDARAVAAAFKMPDAGKGIYGSVTIHAVIDGEVTRQHLEREFEDLGKEVRSDDVFLLYMSGHGETDNGRYYFIPQDANNASHESLLQSSIGQDEIQTWLTHIPALRTVLIYDTCESGSVAEERTGFRESQHLVATEKLSQSVGRTVLAATTDTASATEVGGHGVFTSALLDALARGDENNDGRIEVTELAGYLTANLPNLSEKAGVRRQFPQVKVMGADFTLLNRVTTSAIDDIRRQGLQ
jgi:hypothetical protein